MRPKRWHKPKPVPLASLVLVLTGLTSPGAAAQEKAASGGFGLEQLNALLLGRNKFDFGVGGYAITASSTNGSGSLAGLGLYQLSFRRGLFQRLEFSIGYTIYFSKIISGDSGAGLDIGINYFPFSASTEVSAAMGGQSIRMEEALRPYVGLSFNQRSYQSVQASYNGFGLLVGAEYSLTKALSLNATGRYIRLTGGENVSATELGGVAGISVRF